LIAKVIPGREDAIRLYGNAIEKAVSDDPLVLKLLKAGALKFLRLAYGLIPYSSPQVARHLLRGMTGPYDLREKYHRCEVRLRAATNSSLSCQEGTDAD
jgi:hypothetical protein